MRLTRRLPFACAAAALAITLGSPLLAQNQRPGGIANTYAQNCAACHGANLQGAQAQSLLDDVWLAGSDEEGLAKSIRNGFPEKGMPAWGAAIPEKEIRAMVIYILEQREKHQRGLTQFVRPADEVSAKSKLHNFDLKTWVTGVNEPWSLTFLPDGKALTTEKRGRLLVIENGKLAAKPIEGLPEVDTGGQAGLYDVVPHPDYAKNGWLYLAYSDLQNGQSITKVIRGKLKDGALVEQQTIFQAKPEHYKKAGGVHFGGRIAFDKKGYVFFTIGERGARDDAQKTSLPNGKVHRLHDDGRVPADNPFVKDADAVPSIWSYGHRNPQGLAISPSGQLFDLEHGPRGGDELNLVEKGKNYGWPVITYGMEYSGSAQTDITHKEGMEQPIAYWVPSLAVCGMNFYTGDLFPKWKNQLFIASLAAKELRRIEIKDGKVVTQEVLFKGTSDDQRIRDVIGGPDGALYVLFRDRISKITPAKAGAL